MNKPTSLSKLSLVLAISVGLGGCSLFDGGDDTPPLAGERISILDLEQELKPSADAASVNITVPLAVKNISWAQTGHTSENILGNLEAGDLTKIETIWRADIGEGKQGGVPLTAQPVIADGKVFTIDTKSVIRAFHDQTGKEIWARKVRPEKEDESVINGGLAVNGSTLYITAGYNEVVALNVADGKVIWRQSISAGSRAAPTVRDNRVFIKTLNNNIIALNADDGASLWEYEGVGETTGLLGTASPAADDQIVVAAFSSGDLVALRVENGSVVWSERLINSLQFQSSASLADIKGLPVIDGDMILAVSYGGKMIAVDKRTGLRLWTKDISSAETPLVSGNYIFIYGANQNLMALEKTSGKILWIKQLPKYENPEKRKDPILWTGPVMVNGSLLMTGSNGILSLYEIQKGDLIRRLDTKKTTMQHPVISNGIMYLISQDGTLLALR